jgi:hypothetical protein
MKKKKKTTLSEQFQNPIAKAQKQKQNRSAPVFSVIEVKIQSSFLLHNQATHVLKTESMIRILSLLIS